MPGVEYLQVKLIDLVNGANQFNFAPEYNLLSGTDVPRTMVPVRIQFIYPLIRIKVALLVVFCANG